MLGNYLLIAFRNIARHKLYSFINIAGLAVGLACAIFIALFVRDQLSYDRWIPGAENLYRLETSLNLPGKAPAPNAKAPFAAAQAMLDNIPEVQARARISRHSLTVIVGNRPFSESVEVVDPNFLQVIRLPLAAGDAGQVFRNPNSVVLSQSAARKYFGTGPAIGRTIVISGQKCDASYLNCQVQQQALAVSGVLRDLPRNTQLRIDVMIPNNSAASPVNPEMRENWLFLSSWSYVRLAPGADPAAVTEKFKAVIDRNLDPSKRMNIREKGSALLAARLTPFAEAHLTTDRFGGMTPSGSRTLVYGFAAIGILILLIACFNFTNLASARAMIRAREIALRKVVGAARGQLIVQFLGESVATAMIALLLALALAEILLPSLDRILGLPLAFGYFRDWRFLLFVVGIGALAGLLSGIYPALMLSSFRPASIMRRDAVGGDFARAALVVLQFAVSIGLGIAAVVIFAQIAFTRNLDLGFRKDAIVDVNVNGVPPATVDSLAQALRRSPDIADVAISQAVPFSDDHNGLSAHTPGATSSEDFALLPASPDFMRLYDVTLLAGRLLSEERGADGVQPEQLQGRDVRPINVLINEAAARRLGLSPQAAVGKTLILDPMGGAAVTIVGVVGNIKQDGPKKPVDGTIYMYWRSFPLGHLSVRLRDGHTQEGLGAIDQLWRSLVPGTALQRHFLNDDYNRQFLSDERQGTLFGLFVGIAIFIASLGLFGLAAFATERRTREIGLRKTFGARTTSIIWLLLWQFSMPVLIANAVAWPVAWYWLQGWLQGFASRISLNPLYFGAVGLAALLIAWVTILGHAVRVARANPIRALRYE
jgi:putative ABC transport system permease protein